MHLTPAGLPFGMPGIGLLIDGAVQHAPQFGLHSIGVTFHQKIIFTINRHSESSEESSFSYFTSAWILRLNKTLGSE